MRLHAFGVLHLLCLFWAVGSIREVRELDDLQQEAVTRTVSGVRVVSHGNTGTGSSRWVVKDPRVNLTCFSDSVRAQGATVVFHKEGGHGGLRLVIVEAAQAQVLAGLHLCEATQGPTRSVGASTAIIEEDYEIEILNRQERHHGSEAVLEGDRSMEVSWNLDRIDGKVDGIYSPGGTGQGVHIFIMDTGIRTTHMEFGGRAVPAVDIHQGQGPLVCAAGDTECAIDRNGHGTAVASLVAGVSKGVAKRAQVHAVKMMNDQGSGRFAHYLEGLSWIMEQSVHPKVISSSVGGRFISPVFISSIDDATQAGILVVVAAGNQGDDACSYTPPSVPSALSVGSVDSAFVAAFTSNHGECVDIHAPGVAIPVAWWSADEATHVLSGTSLSAPHASGAAALLLEANPGLSPQGLTDMIKEQSVKGVVTDARNTDGLLLLSVAGLGATPSPDQETTSAPGYLGGLKGFAAFTSCWTHQMNVEHRGVWGSFAYCWRIL